MNNCIKCGAETVNIVVCDACNLPPEGTKYYRYYTEYGGECYFKVSGTNQDVLQVVTKSNAKRGSYKIGAYFIKYNSFIGSKGWKLNESKNTKEISQEEFDSVVDQMLKRIKPTLGIKEKSE